MPSPYLILVDLQRDFVTGALGTPEARAIVPRVVEKVKSFPGKILYTMDTHGADYMDTQEGKLLPVPHCIKGTPGWALIPELAPTPLWTGFEKPTFGSTALAEALAEDYRRGLVSSVTLIGVCTDICVVSNALLIKALLPEVPLYVDSSCCAGVTPEAHRCALSTMKSCQIHVEET